MIKAIKGTNMNNLQYLDMKGQRYIDFLQELCTRTVTMAPNVDM